MMHSTLTHPTLAEHLIPGQSALRHLGLAFGFSLLTGLSAQAGLTLPFTPVPITGQTLLVLLTGMVLGPRLGALSLAMYLAQGAAGLPVFAGGAGGAAVLVGPTAGYLFAFPVAAWLVGRLGARGWDRRVVTTALAMAAGNALIYAGGLAWLGLWLALSGRFGGIGPLLQMGMLPFLPGDALKIVVAMLLLPGAWGLARRRRPSTARP